MCGICGIFNIDGRPVQRDLVEAMNSTMVHRGPDGDGVFVRVCQKAVGQTFKGHQRSRVTDLEYLYV